MTKTRRAFESIGATVEDIDLPSDLGDDQSMIRTFRVVSNSEARVSFLTEYRTNKSRLDPQIQDIVRNALRITRTEKLQAIDRLSKVRSIVDELFARYTVVIAPSAVDEAPLGLADMGSPIFNTIWTVSGIFPVHTSTRGLTFIGFTCASSTNTGVYRGKWYARWCISPCKPIL